MDRYERTLLKQQGEYIYARICCKIAAVLNEKHKSEGHQPDFIIYKAIEFTTKSKVCLERFDRLRDDLDNEEMQDQELPFSGKANVVNPKFHS